MKIFMLLFFLVSCAQIKPTVNRKITSEEISILPSPVVIGCAAKEDIDPQQVYSISELDLPNNHFNIPVVYNSEVKKWITFFTHRGRPWMEKYLNNSTKLSARFSKILKAENLPQDLIFLSMAESGFRNDIMSTAQAAGAWQFMPLTGRQYGLEINYFYDERRHPDKSAQAAAKYLKDLYQLFNSWELAMAAYNAGEGKIKKAIKKYRTTNFWDLTKGRYLKSETKNYVPKIMALAIISKNLSYFGFNHLETFPPVMTIEVAVPAKTDLIKLSAGLGFEFSVLKELNPHYVRWHTPLELNDYRLNIPADKEAEFKTLDFSNLIASDFKVSVYKKLEKASKAYKVPLDYLKVLNHDREKNDLVILPFHKDHETSDRMYYDLKLKPRKSQRRFKYTFTRNTTKKLISTNP